MSTGVEFEFKVYDLHQFAWMEVTDIARDEFTVYGFNADALADLIRKATEALSKLKVPTIGDGQGHVSSPQTELPVRCPKCGSDRVIFSSVSWVYFCENCPHRFAPEESR
jgi:hypothetical protein